MAASSDRKPKSKPKASMRQTLLFSATLTMWQLSFCLGAINLADDLLNQCERYVATWKNIGGVAASLIRETKDVWSAPFRDRDQMAVASSSRSRVTVLGDACHPMTCFKGQGANQALADAVLLARRVAEARGVEHRASDQVEHLA